MAFKRTKTTVIAIFVLTISWLSYSLYQSWFYFKSFDDLNKLSYAMIEREYGKPAVNMEGKFIAWDYSRGIFKTIIEVSSEKKSRGDTDNLLIDKSLWLTLSNRSIQLYFISHRKNNQLAPN